MKVQKKENLRTSAKFFDYKLGEGENKANNNANYMTAYPVKARL